MGIVSDVPLYEPTGFAAEIFRKRYSLHDVETFHEACDRVARHVAAAEENGNVSHFSREFSDVMRRNLFIPGGRILYGSGRPKGQLLNCFVVKTSDSREGWGKTLYDEIVICGSGGGLGINFSPIRPRGTKIAGHRGLATGAVSLMEIVDAAGERLKAGGGRRTALMFALDLTHGDILEFLDKKLDLDELKNANVSVWFPDDPEDFFAKVRADEELKLMHSGRVCGTVMARELWKKIVGNQLSGGEPGLLNGYLMNRMSDIWYHKPIVCTNPCGEQPLEDGGSCCLGSHVLPRYVGTDGKIDWDLLRAVTETAVRLLDDVLTVNTYPLPEIRENCQTVRRIGLGVMGLHDMLLKMGMRYSSPEGLEMVDRVMNFVKCASYEASVDLAKEKGPFPAFDAAKFLKGGFAKTLKPSLREKIRKYGLRNCALNTIPPTGTTALVSGVTSGIEAMFAAAHVRKYRDGDALKKEVVVHPLFREFVLTGRDVSHFEGTYDLSLRDHFEMQRVCQRHVDAGVSKTINVMPGTAIDELSELYMEYFPELKGTTIYPEGSREDQPLSPLSIDLALLAARGEDVSVAADGQSACRDGKCDI